jgi:hypothetical protein
MGVLDLIGFSREIGNRFTLVTVVPLAAFALFVLALLWSGAPGAPPDPDKILDQARDLDLFEAGALILGLILFGLITEPLQVPLVRAFEGYWGSSRLARPLAGWASKRQTAAYKKLDTARRIKDNSREAEAAISREAEAAMVSADQQFKARFPEDEDEVLPTSLGNVLRATETRAGQTYGLQAIVIWPRLYPLLSDPVRALVEDRLNQLDLSVRFSAIFVLSAAVALGLLLSHGWWLAVPVACMALAYFSYRAAIAAATSYGEAVRAAIDLHRFDLLRALHLPLPADLAAERQLNGQLCALLLKGTSANLKFAHEAAGNQSEGEAAEPGAANGLGQLVQGIRARLTTCLSTKA